MLYKKAKNIKNKNITRANPPAVFCYIAQVSKKRVTIKNKYYTNTFAIKQRFCLGESSPVLEFSSPIHQN